METKGEQTQAYLNRLLDQKQATLNVRSDCLKRDPELVAQAEKDPGVFIPDFMVETMVQAGDTPASLAERAANRMRLAGLCNDMTTGDLL